MQRWDIERLYDRYPRKGRRQAQIEKARAAIKSEADYQALSRGVERVRSAWASVPDSDIKRQELEFVPYFGRYAAERMYLDADEALPRQQLRRASSSPYEYLD